MEGMCLYDKGMAIVEEYSKYYFNDVFAPICNVTKRNQTYKSVENRIMSILSNGIKSPDDIFDILAWKTGRIKQKCYKDNQELEYFSGCDKNQLKLKVYGRCIHLCNYSLRIIESIPGIINKVNEGDLKGAFETFLSEAPAGIGSVYAIALLFFITKGELPIYDQYAMKALMMINPSAGISYRTLPSKSNRNFYDRLVNDYTEYISLLESVYKTEYKKCRAIDRALWVYGHKYENKTDD